MVGPVGEVDAGAGVVEHPPIDDDLADALAGRAHPAAVLGGLPASTRAALSHLADFCDIPDRQSAPENPAEQ